MQPLKFHPILKQTLWGGERIVPYKRLDSTLMCVGESWELSGVAGSESVVADGPYAGCTLPELIERFGASLVGEVNYAYFGSEFPLLVKFIDAHEDLSIQVHPGDELAHKRHGKRGKSEMWYVVAADPDTKLFTGFSRPITPAEYEARVADHTLTEVLAHHTIAPGDVFYLPAGRIHSIGRGALIAEIQQTSDVTYRIYDFDRTDVSGKPRELHTDLAREAIDYEVPREYRTHYNHQSDREISLVTTPHFATSLYELTHPMRCDWSRVDSFVVMIFLCGEGVLTDNEGNTTSVRRGETLLIPCSTQWVEVKPTTPSLRFLTSRG